MAGRFYEGNEPSQKDGWQRGAQIRSDDGTPFRVFLRPDVEGWVHIKLVAEQKLRGPANWWMAYSTRDRRWQGGSYRQRLLESWPDVALRLDEVMQGQPEGAGDTIGAEGLPSPDVQGNGPCRAIQEH